MNDTVTKISVGAIINEALAISRRNLKAFGTVALVLVGLPQFGITLVQTAPQSDAVALMAILGLAAGVASVFAQAGLIFGALEDQRGRQLSVAEIFAASRKAFLGVFVVSLIVGLGVGLGMVLLIVPGLILATMWSVATVAQVARDKGFEASLRQSADLTKGNRWRVLGLIAIYGVAIIVIYMIAGAMTLFGGPIGAVVTGLVTVVTTVLGVGGMVALYSALDRAKGGLSAASLAQTFD